MTSNVSVKSTPNVFKYEGFSPLSSLIHSIAFGHRSDITSNRLPRWQRLRTSATKLLVALAGNVFAAVSVKD